MLVHSAEDLFCIQHDARIMNPHKPLVEPVTAWTADDSKPASVKGSGLPAEYLVRLLSYDQCPSHLEILRQLRQQSQSISLSLSMSPKGGP